MKSIEILTQEAIALLKALIETPSFSSEEDKTALLIENWFTQNNIPFEKENNNVWAYNKYFDKTKPTLLLNSHHDTVKPNQGYTNDPFEAIVKDGKLFGLGSNDAGGCLVSLLATFVHFYPNEKLPYNIVMVASAEEESSGKNGLNSVLKHLPELECAIVGEPTLMQLAVAEKGLLVLDVIVKGTASHAAHNNPDNPIYNAIPVIEWFNSYQFEKISAVLGPVKMTVTQINAGKQHNVVPAECHLVIDIRVNDCYNNQEILDTVRKHLTAEVNPRSMHLNASSIPVSHGLVQAGIALGRTTYGSPTLSDQSVLSCQSLKLGPGETLRSHSADEFIFINEIEEGIQLYIKILTDFFKQ
ncbi:M20 family metallo-hydrolase [Flavobacterium gawalongense]|uniref:M20/M25/M40 family metallo-hydrolase n=1 Tax=Flavobacterium gawalongense TaxID=2594432 RepID=A0A553BIV9_9FLAO|nr:M20 family metallo-hydrolase [Flavobacterium gawalongense]TRX00108.1 M20/M25/M40 family metallo-hydrolase [Flavobacterium gawalongense]TRX04799.1 M20/M25/M40 family metallo-hydrolase [Flavobacterium gawalongense]TRX08206.1 M20/M25/M40 family metallo-hydrolase [Flavobacterium gawalongense]TRX08780.1 M20/M25/M40 family metallo-hydrolase [Flavobacterium gawalongense]TRX24708.1 M20/M25/M40 family metallo-hydrolase [Flavobacterium gawalongense]